MPSLLQTLTKVCLVLYLIIETQGQQHWSDEKYTHKPMGLTTDQLRRLAVDEGPMQVPFEPLLDPLLIPRVSGTASNKAVRQYLIKHMRNLGWTIETDKFNDNTPHGVKEFENIIATLNPNLSRRLVIACHFDSKYFKDFDFVAATDSAVPCAMMLHLAHTLREPFNNHRREPTTNVTLQFVFFDGEEAFNHWSNTDSLYGSRHLAAKWEQTLYPPGNPEGTTELVRMDMLMLLDLIGAPKPKFQNFFQQTDHWHNQLVDIENVLRNGRMWSGNIRGKSHFRKDPAYGGIEDDHIPFLQREVPILHVIAAPFPKVWHTEKDTKENLDFNTIANLNRVIRVYVARYLHLAVESMDTDQMNQQDSPAKAEL